MVDDPADGVGAVIEHGEQAHSDGHEDEPGDAERLVFACDGDEDSADDGAGDHGDEGGE